MRADTVAEAIAAHLGMPKAQLLDREAADLPVRMALGEAHVINLTKQSLGMLLLAMTSGRATHDGPHQAVARYAALSMTSGGGACNQPYQAIFRCFALAVTSGQSNDLIPGVAKSAGGAPARDYCLSCSCYHMGCLYAHRLEM